MSFADYAEGAILLALMLTGVLAGAWLLLVRRFGHLPAAPRLVAYALLATLGVLAVHLGPAVLGVLDRWTVTVATALWLAVAWRAPRAAEIPGPGAEPESEPEPRSEPVAWAATGLAVAGLVLFAVLAGASRLTFPTYGVDALNFHLPGIAAWIQSGSIWQIDVYLPDLAPGHYPNNGDVVLLASILPWRNDFLSHLAMYPFWPLLGVGVYALSRELRAPRWAAVMAACLVVSVPSVGLPALAGGLTDPLGLFALAAGLLFLVRHHRTGRVSDLVMAGLGLGVCFGTKWYGVSTVAVVLVVWALASWRSRGGLGAVLRQGIALLALVGLGGGVWLVRNLVESGNPFFPVKVAPFGVTIFDAPRDVIRELGGFTIADYLDDPGVWSDYILPQYEIALAAPTALIAIGALAAAALLATARGTPRPPLRGLALTAAACAALLTVMYSVLPYTAGGAEGMPHLVAADARYLTPAIVVAGALLAWLVGRLRPGRLSAAASVLCLLAVADGVRRTKGGIDPAIGSRSWLEAAVVLAVAIAVGVGLLAVANAAQGRARRVALGGIAAAFALVLGGTGHEVQQRYNEKRYVGRDEAVDYLLGPGGSGNRVGLTGTWPDDAVPPPLPAYGPRYRNEVIYLGRSDQDVLRQYRSRGPFTRALERSRIDLLVVGRGRPPAERVAAERWAEAAGFDPVARSDRLTVLRSGSSSAPG